ncbi:hypothetical protein K435DRAFT_832273 [Dendrothele bispora CBS 962.96]|uniref:Uncharacterized protein n=1 Tax=Dendrothele bispora (strain CBS 962.96) TaxID=1314807 RepID=A0A4S8KSQ3_DENBC|nr:hypothetical protein K435DRAFT_832273 [Dendrothele bispora CBS 962.96]
MGRTEIDQGNIKIAYGHDEATGYFLSVVDERLGYKEDISDAVLAVMEKVNADQGGGYFDLHTAPIGFGHRVDKETLIYFWKQYGVPESDIEKARKGQKLKLTNGSLSYAA